MHLSELQVFVSFWFGLVRHVFKIVASSTVCRGLSLFGFVVSGFFSTAERSQVKS